MPRAPPESLERAKKTADRYISRSGSAPPEKVYGRDERGFELAQHKLKIRQQKDEIAKLKRSLKAKDAIIAKLQNGKVLRVKMIRVTGDVR